MREHATGFLYAISVTGVTGTRQQLSADAAALLSASGGVTDLPVAVGFGISNAEQARETWAQGADAVIVGSAIVRRIEEFGARAARGSGTLRARVAGVTGGGGIRQCLY